MTDAAIFAAWCAVWCVGLTWARVYARRKADGREVPA